MSIVLQSSGGGSVTLQEAVTASNLTITVPAVTGTMNLVGPAFSAYASATTTLSNGTFTKILFATEEFDTNNNFASSTFTPTVAGYYQVTFVLAMPTGTSPVGVSIYKNGSRFKDGNFIVNNSTTGSINVATALIYMNGSTDYLDAYGIQTSGGSLNCNTGVNQTYFQAAMVRGA